MLFRLRKERVRIKARLSVTSQIIIFVINQSVVDVRCLGSNRVKKMV